MNLLTGQWADFADPEARGGDLIALYAAIRHISQLDAAKELDETPVQVNGHVGPVSVGDDESPQMQRPPNVDFQPSMFKHRQHGTPTAFWVYRDTEGPLFIVARYDITGQRKTYSPWIWNSLRWLPKGPPKPRPLYGLDRLTLARPVLLVEGEKAADAAALYWPRRPCLTWMNGAGGVSAADWEPLRGLDVTLWPDADVPGKKAMATVAEKLLTLGCRVSMIHVDGMPEGWDLADAMQERRSAAEMTAYAKAHAKALNPVVEPTPVVVSPPAGSQTYEPGAAKGSWLERWQRWGFVGKSNGRPYMNQSNVARAIDVRGDMNVYYDSFAHRIMSHSAEWSDEMTSRFTHFLQTEYGFYEMHPNVVFEGVRSYAFEHQRNPPAEWLNSLTWDETPRLCDLLTVGLGAKSGEYTASVGRCFMVGMVARVLNPGCKVDTMPIFEGIQGAGKSTALKIIGGQYFAEIHESISSKDFYIAITGKMLCEISELNSLRKADVERIKGVLTTATDRFRAPYGTTAVDRPRACVFAGTTNNDDWNNDETGARRFWPVRCGEIDREWLTDNRPQLFAEAVSRYRAGESWWDVPEEAALMERLARHDSDVWTDVVYRWAITRDAFSTASVIAGAIEMDKQQADQRAQNRVSKILRAIGFESKAKREDGQIVRRWVRK